jgi:hypothetical protein
VVHAASAALGGKGVAIGLAVVGFVSADDNLRAVPRFPHLGARPPSQACPRPAVKFDLTNATSAFDDFSQPRYDKLWRISVLRLVVSFLFRIPIRCLNARGIWCLVAGH